MQFQASSNDSISFTIGRSATGGHSFGLDDSSRTLNRLVNGGHGTASIATNGFGSIRAGSHGTFLCSDHIAATNNMVSQKGNSISSLFLGQLGLSHRMTEVRKAIVTPHGSDFML